jgi:sugar lactone lactonase YvrE
MSRSLDVVLTTLASAAAAFVFATGARAAAPTFWPLYDGVAQAPAATRIVNSQGPGVFLENIVALADGSFAITSLLDGRILRLKGERATTWAVVPGHASGIESDRAGGVYVGGWGKDERRVLWHVGAAGGVRELLALPEAALPNGITTLSPGVLLVADSVKGLIWRVDLAKKSVSTWLADPLLGGFDPGIEPAIPAVNGLKRHGGHLYASNMSLKHLVRIVIRPDGSAGAAEVYVKDAFADDFVVDPKGRIFATTHAYDSVIRIDTDRRISVLGGREQGLQGATAVAFDASAPKGQLKLMAITNGGVYVPPAWGVEDAKMVTLVVPAAR